MQRRAQVGGLRPDRCAAREEVMDDVEASRKVGAQARLVVAEGGVGRGGG